VQYCHSGVEVKHEPEYVFALNRDSPRQGLFVPFYMYFLEHWEDPRHPEYDFAANELVYRDAQGRETGRARLALPGAGTGVGERGVQAAGAPARRPA
jgi:hypothetical protein